MPAGPKRKITSGNRVYQAFDGGWVCFRVNMKSVLANNFRCSRADTGDAHSFERFPSSQREPVLHSGSAGERDPGGFTSKASMRDGSIGGNDVCDTHPLHRR